MTSCSGLLIVVAMTKREIAPAEGRLGVLTVGLGAVATTLIAGVELTRRGMGHPIGSLTQMATIRLGKRTENRFPFVKDFVPLADLNDIVFTGWDIFEDNVYESAAHAKVLDKDTLEQLRPYLEKIKPMPAVFDQYYVKRLHGTHIKKGASKFEMVEQLRADIPQFKAGDTVKVHFRVIEGTRQRLQVYQGIVIKRQGAGVRETFTVRKQSFGVGVERTFPLHSPKIEKIDVIMIGDVRRAKLYYLRQKVGKQARVREKQR